MNHHRRVVLGLLAVIGATPALAGLVPAEGILNRLENTFCETVFYLNNPCTGENQLVSYHQDLNPYLCEYMSVIGPESGVECTHITIQFGSFTSPACNVQVPSLLLSYNSSGTLVLQWSQITCTEANDIVRGSLDELSAGDLGAVTCVAENVAGSQKALPGDPDPLPGEAFFYLVRATGGEWGFTHYGHTSEGEQRFPLSGDCAP
jgi:hypothetical protein